MIPTEPIGSIPRPKTLIDGQAAFAEGTISPEELRALQDEALADTIQRFEETGSPVISDGEQTKSSFVTYPLDGVTNLAADGVVIPFADGHTRQLPTLASGPFRFGTYAASYLQEAKKQRARAGQAGRDRRLGPEPPLPAGRDRGLLARRVPGRPRRRVREGHPRDRSTPAPTRSRSTSPRAGSRASSIRRAGSSGTSWRSTTASSSASPTTSGPGSACTRARAGTWTRRTAPTSTTPQLLPDLFQLNVGNVYVEMAGEQDPGRVLDIIAEHLRPEQRIFVGVIDPIDPAVESPEQVRDRVLEAADRLPQDRLGTTDDCGFSPFGDDDSTSRDVAFEKIRARIEGTRLAEERLGL